MLQGRPGLQALQKPRHPQLRSLGQAMPPSTLSQRQPLPPLRPARHTKQKGYLHESQVTWWQRCPASRPSA